MNNEAFVSLVSACQMLWMGLLAFGCEVAGSWHVHRLVLQQRFGAGRGVENLIHAVRTLAVS